MMCDDDGELLAMGSHQNYHNYENYKYEHLVEFSSNNLLCALTGASDRFDSEYLITSANGLPLPRSRDGENTSFTSYSQQKIQLKDNNGIKSEKNEGESIFTLEKSFSVPNT